MSDKRNNLKIFKDKIEQKQHQNKVNKRRFYINVFLFFLIIVVAFTVYFNSKVSKIININVLGNQLLTKEEVLSTAEVSTSSYHILSLPLILEYRLKSHPLIQDAKVEWGMDRSITINVEEIPVFAYSYAEQPELILRNGEKVLLTQDYYSLLSQVPFLQGFSEEHEQQVILEFSKLESSVFNNISEIIKTEFSFDKNHVKVIMRDGYVVYTSIYTINELAHYFEIRRVINTDHKCIYIDDLSKHAYAAACPVDQ